MRASNIIFIVWFIVAITLDKFVQSYYNIILLTLSGIFLFAIHKLNMRERTKAAEESKQPNNQKNQNNQIVGGK